MSLNWSTEKVRYFTENPDTLWKKYREGTVEEYEDVNAETKALIFGTMALCLNQITMKNAADFYARWKVFEKFDNFYLYSIYDGQKSIKTYLTPEVVAKHIGLSTNATTRKETEWVNNLAKNYERENREVPVTKKDIQDALKEAKEEYETYIYNKITEG